MATGTMPVVYRGKLRLAFQILFVIVLFQQGDQVLSAQLTWTNETKIIKQLKLNGVCRDYNGVEMMHLDQWPSGVDVCDQNTCFIGQLFSYVISATCPPITSDDNPDEDNCHAVSDDSQKYPGCCEKLECSTSPPLTTISPTLCRDRSPASSCLFWSKFGTDCSQNSTYYEGFLKDYCKKTCGYCT